jgi:hypothetical protein
MNTISRHAARVVDVYAGLPHIARKDSSQEEYGVNHQEIAENGFQIATVDKGLFSQSKVNLTPEIGVDFICLARGPGQQVWIEDMILMKKLSMTLLSVESQGLYKDYKYDDLIGLIYSLDEIYK